MRAEFARAAARIMSGRSHPYLSDVGDKLGVEVELLKDVFIWAYERSALRYAAVRQSLGEPDPFRVKHRTALQEIIREIVIEAMDRKSAFTRIAEWARSHIEPSEREKFREVAENEIRGLHEGNFARYKIRPSQFEAWQRIWSARR